MPVAWILDAEIILPELDKDFYEHIDEIKNGYVEMYPKLKFGGKLTVQKLVDNSKNFSNDGGAATFFSGGVDSFATLINHIDEHPTLITLWGSDIKLNDFTGWKNVKKHALETANQFKCKNFFIKSSFRQFINEGLLSGLVDPIVHDGWWHGFQHGIGIISHAAPYVYCNKISKIYFASSFSENQKGTYTCASDPTIDNYLYVGKCQTVHDGYEFNRQDKVRNICKYRRQTDENIQLRVCWESSGGQNCCHCEKCYRTILAILVEGENPEKYGFIYSAENVKQMHEFLKSPAFIYDKLNANRYIPIIKRFHEIPQNLQKPEIQKWLELCDVSTIEKIIKNKN